MSGDTRPPAVSGAFYEDTPASLRRQVQWCFDHPVGPGRRPHPWGNRRVIGLIGPHAGLMYSGPVAAHAYLRLAEARRPEVIVIIGPDHHGRGAAVSVAPEARWRTPLGEVATEHALKTRLAAHGLPLDARGHAHEHAVEVHLPFVQCLGYDGAVVPIAMAAQDAGWVYRLARALTAAADEMDVVVIASTDLSHFLPHAQAVQTDRQVLDAILSGDGATLLELVTRERITMCGSGVAAVTLEVARRLGASRVEILRYATSRETGGDPGRVVGYAAVVLEAA
jgi:AmmeMemoRadiSam system protein B